MTKHITAPVAEWIDAYTNPPPNGSKVLGLTRGGKLIECVFMADSLSYLDAWASYPKVSAAIKQRQVERYMKGSTND